MAINIKNPDVDRLIQELRAMTGEGPTEIVKRALEREYQELRRERRQTQLAENLSKLQEIAQTKVQYFDPNTLYDENGLPL
ncbi:Rv0623 family protein transcription factor [Halothece sp. PCC 7418]|uniref:type II toxin-antitoxin system VapB family antitoxin n=1 Tax=Halothece sp. (strain PCC 7418) TaxID=65093 RepID=UPI0002A07220|nr:type II toxin-antitoxin system VapB family antitoxin [Halothece sp. PCC 7418]AFZ42530.1 Rv0623 family protein transcription factor [Halothece sp. PCC 7418]